MSAALVATNVTDATFASEVLEATDTVLVEFWAEWCGPCRAVSPILDRIAEENPDKIRVVKVNADDNPETALKYQITSIPAMMVFRDGKVQKRITGAKPKPALEHDLAAFLA
jgi:thioredoxin 1